MAKRNPPRCSTKENATGHDEPAECEAFSSPLLPLRPPKPLGEGVSELRINRGPGYRIYFGWDGKLLVILLGGGTKRRQQSDIQTAFRHWRSYKARKAAGRPRRS